MGVRIYRELQAVLLKRAMERKCSLSKLVREILEKAVRDGTY